MRAHFHHELERLGGMVARLGREVRTNVGQALEAAAAGDREGARAARQADRRVDAGEVRIEEECLKVIALHQPVADDLRYLVTLLKVNHELERIGDLAKDIAATVEEADPAAVEPFRVALVGLGGLVRRMLERGIDALLARDEALAEATWMSDDEADRLADELLCRVRERAEGEPSQAGTLFGLAAAARALERMADHAANIAKHVIYLVSGEIVRHRRGEVRRRRAGANGAARPGADPAG